MLINLIPRIMRLYEYENQGGFRKLGMRIIIVHVLDMLEFGRLDFCLFKFGL